MTQVAIKLFPATITVPESTSEDIACTIRIGYAEEDAAATIDVADSDVLSASGSLGVSSSETEDATATIVIPEEWARNFMASARVVTGAIADINGTLYVLFDGTLSGTSSLGIIGSSGNQGASTYTTGEDDDSTMEGDFRSHITILAAGSSAPAYIQPCTILVQVNVTDDFAAALDLYEQLNSDTVGTVGIQKNAFIHTPSYIALPESTSHDMMMHIKVISNIAAVEYRAFVNVIPGIGLTSTVNGLIKISESKIFNTSSFLIVSHMYGSDFDASLGVKRPSHRSIGCNIFIADHYATGLSQYGAMGASGGDIDSPAGIPPRPVRSHGIIPVQSEREGMSVLPSWMDMVKYSHSVGAQYFNAIDTELDSVQKDLQHQAEKYFIETCMPKLDTIGFAPLPASGVTSATVPMYEKSNGDRYRWRLADAKSLHKFYHADTYFNVDKFSIPDGTDIDLATWKQTGTGTFDVYWVDEDEKLIYFRFSNGHYNTVEINGKPVTITWRHVWNELDDIGALLHINRLPNESNSSFRARILDIFDNVEYITTTRSGGERVVTRDKFPDSTFIGLSTMLARELNIPAQDDEGKFNIKVKALSDRNFQVDELLDKDMLPNERFINYVNRINKEAKVTWGNAKWDHSRWIEDSDARRYPRLKSIWDILSLRNRIE